MVRLGPGGAHHVVALPQADAPDAHGLPAHGPHVVLVKAHRHAVVGGDEDALLSIGLPHGDQLVPLIHAQGADSVVPQVFQGVGGQALHGAASGDHEEEAAVVLDGPGVDHGLDPLSRLHLEDIDDIGALGRLARFRDLIALLPVRCV